jgi:LmbE family N-acetylglucosaminyl deacetylase
MQAFTHTLKRWILRQMVRRTRPYLSSYGLLKTVKYKQSVAEMPNGKVILVLAPHMDDEVIGCGGAIYQHALLGAEVTVVYLTDGRSGSRELLNYSGEERHKRELELIATRKREAEQALAILRVHQGTYWGVEETTLTRNAELPVRLAELLKALRPDIVYLPFFLEEHSDHRAVNQLLSQSASIAQVDFDCFGYEVWTPLFPNYLIDISAVIEVKRKALEQYHSQLSDMNYIHTSFGLNAYRSSALLETGGYAEAFFCAPVREYLNLYKSFCASLSGEARGVTSQPTSSTYPPSLRQAGEIKP